MAERVGGEDVEAVVANERGRAGDRVEDVLHARADLLWRGRRARRDGGLGGAGEVEQVQAFGFVELSALARASRTLSDTPWTSPRSSRV